MSDTGFPEELKRLEPARTVATDALIVSYEAGRRDEAAAARKSILRWRVAAGVLLAATLGLAAMQLGGDGAPRAQRPIAQTPPLEKASEPIAMKPPAPAVIPRPLPGSYASLRSAVMAADAGNIDELPGAPAGGPGGERAMTARDAM